MTTHWRRRADEERNQHCAHRDEEGVHRLIGDVTVEYFARNHGEEDIHQRDNQRAEHIQQKHAHVRLVERGKLADCARAWGRIFLQRRKGAG